MVRGMVDEVDWDYGTASFIAVPGLGTGSPFPQPRPSFLLQRGDAHLSLQPNGVGITTLPPPLRLRVQQGQSSDPLPSILRHIPVLRGLVPAPSRVLGGAALVLRVRLLPSSYPATPCTGHLWASCDEGVVLTPIQW